jgi:hypothetical protein
MIKSLTVSFAALAILAADAHAQIRASERGTVSQTVDGTTITIDYSRPQVRGRDDLFGGEIPWGKLWTPGANWATTIAVDHDITINGHELATGTYSVWFEVQQDEWTVILDPEPKRFHLMGPPKSDDQVRFALRPGTGPNVEVMTWSFPAVRPTGATLQMAWADVTATFDLGVASSRDVTVTADFAERFVGTYSFQLMGPLGDGTVEFDITYEGDHLVAYWPSPPAPRLGRFWLAPLGAGMFNAVELEKDEIFDIVTDVVFEFTPLEGKATMFEFRVLGDELWGSAKRAE